MASQQAFGFGFGFDNCSNAVDSSNGWGNQSANQEQDNSSFGLWTPNMFSPIQKDELTKDQIIEDLKTQLKTQENKIKTQNHHINHLNGLIENLNVDVCLRNETIKELKKENEELKYEQQSTALVKNQSSIRNAVLLLNSPQNNQVSSNYSKVVVFSSRAKEYFTCLKLWDGKWIEGALYTKPIHNLTPVKLY